MCLFYLVVLFFFFLLIVCEWRTYHLPKSPLKLNFKKALSCFRQLAKIFQRNLIVMEMLFYTIRKIHIWIYKLLLLLLFMWSLQFQRTTQTFSGIKHLPYLPKSLHQWKSGKRMPRAACFPWLCSLFWLQLGWGHTGHPQLLIINPITDFHHLGSASITYGSQTCGEMSLCHLLPMMSLCRSTSVCTDWGREWQYERAGQQNWGISF